MPTTQAVPDGRGAARSSSRAFHAARAIGREDGACRGCYPTDASEITEDMNARTGDQYGAAATLVRRRGCPAWSTSTRPAPAGWRAARITLYARTSNGTIWRLRAARGRPHLGQARVTLPPSTG